MEVLKNIEERDRELFDKIAQKYAKKDIAPSSIAARAYQINAAIGPILKKNKNLDILEIACGVGATAKYLRGQYKSYVGLDYSEQLIFVARGMHAGNPQASFLVKNIKDLRTDDLSVKPDLILAIGALHHMTDLGNVLETLKKVSRPGAIFVAMEPSKSNPFIMLLRKIRMALNRDYSSDQKFFSREELIGLLKLHGLANIEVEHQGFFTPPFAQVILRPQFLFLPLSRAAVAVDEFLDVYLPEFFKSWGWNLIIRAEFP